MSNNVSKPDNHSLITHKIQVSGQVQGVGYRPFIYALAQKHDLKGYVCNQIANVEIVVQGTAKQILAFEQALVNAAPAVAAPCIRKIELIENKYFQTFAITDSNDSNQFALAVPLDLPVCDLCLNEMLDRDDRRYLYPFINCAQCGPRYSIIDAMPYDRINTAMRDFVLCAACELEYKNPLDRRYHAQAIACPRCGPQLILEDSNGQTLNSQDVVQTAVQLLNAGKILAIKGIGGFHVVVDAANDKAVRRLRRKKIRPDKPLAVMFPAPVEAPLSRVEQFFVLSAVEKKLLLSVQRPIVLLKPGLQPGINQCLANSVNPGLNEVGVFLPYSPLHYLLLHYFDRPLVASSANASGQAMIYQDETLRQTFQGGYDAVLRHERSIVNRADDSVYRIINNRPCLIRPGRGVSPTVLRHERPIVNGIDDSVYRVINNRPCLLPPGRSVSPTVLRHERPIVNGVDDSVYRVINNRPCLLPPGRSVSTTVLRHERPIVNRVDDSVYRVINNRPCLIPPGSGVSPTVLRHQSAANRSYLAVGGHAKNTLALLDHEQIIVSPYIGDLSSPSAYALFKKTITKMQALYRCQAKVVVCDCHPDYQSSRWASQSGLELIAVQHHRAHASALWFEQPDWQNCMVFTWDGYGLGDDQSLWGAEVFTGQPGQWLRAGTFKALKLVGAARASREIWRNRLSIELELALNPDNKMDRVSAINSNKMLDKLSGQSTLSDINDSSYELYQRAWLSNQAVHRVHSVGRLFDAAASIIRNQTEVSYEGQAACELEHCAQTGDDFIELPVITVNGVFEVDWRNLFKHLITDKSPAAEKAGLFHNTLAHSLLAQARLIQQQTGIDRVGLTGGVFQNRLLTEKAIQLLESAGFSVGLHNAVACNDSGLAVGQLLEATAMTSACTGINVL